MARRITVWLLIAAMLIMNAMPVYAAEPELIITGTGLEEEIVITSGDWSKYKMVERIYSTKDVYKRQPISSTTLRRIRPGPPGITISAMSATASQGSQTAPR